MTVSHLYAIVDAQLLAGRGVSLRDFAEELQAADVRLVQWRDKAGSPQEVLQGAAILREVFARPESVSKNPRLPAVVAVALASEIGPGFSPDIKASRDLGFSPRDMLSVGITPRQATNPPETGYPLLIMNDRADLALLAGFDAVHVGQGDLSPEDAKAVVSRTITHPFSEDQKGWATRLSGFVGVSTHIEEQVQLAELSCADYVAIGPVFATGTKPNAEAVVGLEGVRRARALTTKPLVAIGGITRANARSVIDAGADSVAVISGLFAPGESVEKVARDFLEILG